LCDRYRVPIVVTGFEPLDLLEGIRRAVAQLEQGAHRIENAYARAVSESGNVRAQEVIGEVFVVTDRVWRGMGRIPRSGWKLSPAYEAFDASLRYANLSVQEAEPNLCRAGEVLRGTLKPYECPAFGKECTPRTPLGATMVSSEGACAAHYHYRNPTLVDLQAVDLQAKP
jgi:hydrogenase expression/formation protein HypD